MFQDPPQREGDHAEREQHAPPDHPRERVEARPLTRLRKLQEPGGGVGELLGDRLHPLAELPVGTAHPLVGG